MQASQQSFRSVQPSSGEPASLGRRLGRLLLGHLLSLLHFLLLPRFLPFLLVQELLLLRAFLLLLPLFSLLPLSPPFLGCPFSYLALFFSGWGITYLWCTFILYRCSISNYQICIPRSILAISAVVVISRLRIRPGFGRFGFRLVVMFFLRHRRGGSL